MDALVGGDLDFSAAGLRSDRIQGPERKALLFCAMETAYAPFIAARLKRSGLIVDAFCPRNHVLDCSVAVSGIFRFSFATPLRSVRRAIAASRADLIVPCDDTARYTLSRFHRASAKWRDSQAIAARLLIERSLGQCEHFQLAEEKSGLFAALADSGVRLPRTLPIDSTENLEEACRTLKFPLVLKRDRTCGGTGVAICRGRAEALREYQRLRAPPTLRNTLRRIVRKTDFSAIRDRIAGRSDTIVAQAYVHGRPANRAVSCWQGEVLAGLTVVALETSRDNATRPATVVQIFHNEEIDRMAATVVGRLGLSGLCGLDFVMEAGTNAPYFLELNPRATPTCHLGRAPGTDLCTALGHAIKQTSPDDEITVEDTDEPIALFPGELWRDPHSRYLVNGHHAVPWDDPQVLAHLLKQPREKS
jgi:glutathione synthase/RimK-type ligase-like ATP-grasp enzyme